jgi:tape measure domain-containing protein
VGQPIDTASVEIVPDFSSFARELKSGVDSALRQLVSEVDRSFERVERAASEAGTDVGREFQRGGERAEGALREVATTAKLSMASVAASTDTASTAIGTRLSGAIALAKAALIGLGLAAAAGLGAMTVFGLKSAASLEQVQIGFESMLGSAEAAKSFLEELQKFSAATPFEFQGVADASRRILAFGSSVGIAREQVIPTLTTIGDLVSVLGGTQENIDGVIRAFGQVASKGRLMGGEILQIAEQLPGFNVNQAIAAKLGVSVADALKAQEAGTIDAKTAIDGILEGMAKFPGAAGAMIKQSQTLTGVFSTFKDTLGITLTNAFQPVIPAIKDSLSQLTPILGTAVGQLAPAVAGVLSGLLPLLGQIVQAITPVLVPLLNGLADAFGSVSLVLIPLGQAIGTIASAIAPIIPVFAGFFALLANALVPVMQALAPVFAAVVAAIRPLLDIITPLFPVFAGIATTIATALLPVIQLLGKIFSKLGPPILKIVMALAELFLPLIDLLVPLVDQLIVAFLPFIDLLVELAPPILEIIKAFMPLISLIVALVPAMTALSAPLNKLMLAFATFITNEAIVPLLELVAQALVMILSPLNLLVPLIEAFTKFLTEMDWGKVGDTIKEKIVGGFVAVQKFLEGIPDFFADVFRRVVSVVASGIDGAVHFISSLPGRVVGIFTGAAGWLYNVGRDTIQGFINGAGNLLSRIGSFLIDKLPGWIVTPFKLALGISSPSKVFAAIGEDTVAGYLKGLESTIPAVNSLLSTIVPGGGASQSGSSAIAAAMPAIIVNVMFSGVVPTEGEARRTGAAAGAGVAQALARRDIALAGRVA